MSELRDLKHFTHTSFYERDRRLKGDYMMADSIEELISTEIGETTKNFIEKLNALQARQSQDLKAVIDSQLTCSGILDPAIPLTSSTAKRRGSHSSSVSGGSSVRASHTS